MGASNWLAAINNLAEIMPSWLGAQVYLSLAALVAAGMAFVMFKVRLCTR
jgi:hypothetical protein